MKQTILNLWQENETLSKHDNSKVKCAVGTKVSKSNLCNYNNAYILVRSVWWPIRKNKNKK